MDLNINFINMSDEDLDELITRAKEIKESRTESRKLDSWKKVMQAVQDYIMDYGCIELFTHDLSEALDIDCFRIPGEINLPD